MANSSHLYLIALGSNVRTVRDGLPGKVLSAAVDVLEELGLLFHAVAPTITTSPIGVSRRRFANSAALVETFREPEELLGLLKATEQSFGRKSVGQRWSARVLDLDIILWDGGIWECEELIIPHPEFRQRDFVLEPACAIARHWRDPVTNLSVAHLFARLTKPRPAPR